MMVLERIQQQQCHVFAAIEQEKHLGLCLAEVQEAMKSVNQFVQAHACHDGMGTVLSIIQLVFFEVYSLTHISPYTY
jgi:hypothetical protein